VIQDTRRIHDHYFVNPDPAPEKDDVIVESVAEQFEIPIENMWSFKEKAKKLGQKAKRLGLPPIEVDIGPVATVWMTQPDFSVWPPAMRRKQVRVRIVSVSGPVIHIPGWMFVAKIEHSPHGNIISRSLSVSDTHDLSRYYTSAAYCDHCKTVRRRKDTFVIMNEEGEERTVGRSCLKDFLQARTINQIAFSTSFIKEIKDELADPLGGWGGSKVSHAPWDQFMAFAARAVLVQGGYHKDPLTGHTTGDDVVEILINWKLHKLDPPEEARPNDVSDALAAEVEAWLDDQERGDRITDYIHNVLSVRRSGIVPWNRGRLVTSVVGSYLREKGRAVERERRRAEGGEHVGQVKKRQVFEGLQVIFSKMLLNDWGETYLYKFADPDGNILVWFASSPQVVRDRVYLGVGDTIDLKATVKKHDSYEGVPQTIVTRGVIQR
jgi:hypothetical protein